MKIVETNSQIMLLINGAIADELNDRIVSGISKVNQEIKNILELNIKSSPEWISLDNGGILQKHFGLVNATAKLATILSIWVNSFNTKFNKVVPSTRGVKGGFEINYIKSDYSDVLSLAEATQDTNKGQKLEWLRWLLLEGDKAIIRGYEISMFNDDKSRTDGPIMVKKTGGIWRVPPQYSGTISDNFITRTISTIQNDIDKVIEDAIK